MKTNKTIVCGFLAVMFALAFVACPDGGGGGDDSSNEGGNIPSTLVGKWYSSVDGTTLAFEITSTGKFIYDTQSYDISVSDNTLELKSGGVTVGTFDYSISNGAMTISNGTGVGMSLTSLPPMVKGSGGNGNNNNGGGGDDNSGIYDTGTPGLWIEYFDYGSFGMRYEEGCWVMGYIGTSSTVIIPATYNGNPVIGILGYAFLNCTSLTSVTIPEGVTKIGDWAFKGCTGLASVTIPSSVTSIGSMAFNGCTGLTSVTIPSSVTSIGGWAFAGCTSLTSITIPDGVKVSGESAFAGCTSLTTVTFAEGSLSIVSLWYSGLSGITTVNIPSSVTSIGEMAFYNCTSLTSITIPTSVTFIGNIAFIDWTDKQTIIVQGHANEASADAAWGKGWRSVCKAKIVYQGQS